MQFSVKLLGGLFLLVQNAQDEGAKDAHHSQTHQQQEGGVIRLSLIKQSAGDGAAERGEILTDFISFGIERKTISSDAEKRVCFEALRAITSKM